MNNVPIYSSLRAELPAHVVSMLNNMPSKLHPMSQFSAAVTALNSESSFVKAYTEGVHKSKYWEVNIESFFNYNSFSICFFYFYTMNHWWTVTFQVRIGFANFKQLFGVSIKAGWTSFWSRTKSRAKASASYLVFSGPAGGPRTLLKFHNNLTNIFETHRDNFCCYLNSLYRKFFFTVRL